MQERRKSWSAWSFRGLRRSYTAWSKAAPRRQQQVAKQNPGYQRDQRADHRERQVQAQQNVAFKHEIETAKVTTDDYAAGLLATEHLIINGGKKIAFLSISAMLSIDNKRRQGYLEALNKHNIQFNKSYSIKCTNNDASNYLKIKKLLTSKNKPDAIFASIEKLAITVYEVCNDLKINIPKDLKIIYRHFRSISF